jgi:hypothetical protein
LRKGRALRPPPPCFDLLRVGEFEGRPMCWPRFCARLRPSAVWVRIRSGSTSAKPPNTASIKRPVLVPVSADGSAKGSELRLGVHDLLDDGEQVKGAAREVVDGVTVTTSPGARPPPANHPNSG